VIIICDSKYSGLKFQGFPIESGFKPALVRRNVLFKTVLLNTTPRDPMKRTAKPGLGQGLERYNAVGSSI
jgi:hypothetical protein